MLLITASGVLLPIASPPAATGDSSLRSVPAALGASEKSCQRKLLGREPHEGFRVLRIWIFILGTKKACDPLPNFMNHKDCAYRTTLVYVVIAIDSRAQTSDTSSVLGWGVLAFMAEHVGSREVNEARRPHTCSRPCAFEEKKSRKTKTMRKFTPPRTHHERCSSPANANTSRRRANHTSHALAHACSLP